MCDARSVKATAFRLCVRQKCRASARKCLAVLKFGISKASFLWFAPGAGVDINVMLKVRKLLGLCHFLFLSKNKSSVMTCKLCIQPLACHLFMMSVGMPSLMWKASLWVINGQLEFYIFIVVCLRRLAGILCFLMLWYWCRNKPRGIAAPSCQKSWWWYEIHIAYMRGDLQGYQNTKPTSFRKNILAHQLMERLGLEHSAGWPWMSSKGKLNAINLDGAVYNRQATAIQAVIARNQVVHVQVDFFPTLEYTIS